jgi:hypothetical protein
MPFENINEDQVPELIRTFFEALRHPEEDDDNHTFGVVQVEVNGQPAWAIAAVIRQGEGTVIMPMFAEIPPNCTVTMDGNEGSFITFDEMEASGKERD